MNKRKKVSILFMVLLLLVSSTMIPMASYASECSLFSECPPDRPCVECHSKIVCTRWEVLRSDELSCLAGCAIACAIPSNFFLGVACSIGCGIICLDYLPKTCVEYKMQRQCYCEGDHIPYVEDTELYEVLSPMLKESSRNYHAHISRLKETNCIPK